MSAPATHPIERTAATAILLIVIVILLNLTAIVVRSRLRRKYQSAAF